MSLKFFFNRHGFVIRILNTLALIVSLYNLYYLKSEWQVLGMLTVISYLTVLMLAGGIYFCAYFPWYKKADRGWGIEEHFAKMVVPTGYVLVLTNLIFIFWQSPLPLLITVIFVLAILLCVNSILIYLHLKDKSLDPPSLYVRNFHLNEKK